PESLALLIVMWQLPSKPCFRGTTSMLMHFYRTIVFRLTVVTALSGAAASCAARYATEGVSASHLSDCVLSSDSLVRRVQRNPEFEGAANRIARRTYAKLPEYQGDEVARICTSLKILPGTITLAIVYGEAYQMAALVPVYFGVDRARVQTLNPVIDDEIRGGLGKDAWNDFILRNGKLAIRSDADAASIGCLLHTLQTSRFLRMGCEFYEPVQVHRIGSDWVVNLNEGSVRFTSRGELR